ncbi:hypothetical protein I3842_13G096400 [Carya illinoinensis]|uniref:Integral membrane bound transporter domain-containing protein n=1 Tax=Carya illinoinensis TaxID=32201 RepID=A0A922APA4_CARIL|nr:hypothetical protein I3842_13G096400 [Carya illinoinensis]
MLPVPDQYFTNRAREGRRACIASAFRTAFACIIVGCTTMYGYTLRGCWLALFATVQSVGAAILCLRVIEPARFSSLTTALAVALRSFVVALPESTHLVSKRIGLGQVVIVYVVAFINGSHTDPVMHPLHVAASTAVGVLACVLALLLPYPRLAYSEVKQNSKLLAENVSETLNASALVSISRAKSLAGTGTELLSSIERHQESMQWEGVSVTKLQHWQALKAGEYRWQDIMTPFRGMEMALTGNSSYPARIMGGELKDESMSSLPCDPPTVPESNAEDIMKSLQALQTIPTAHQDLPSYFFLFCMKFLHCNLLAKPSAYKKGKTIRNDENNGISLHGVSSNLPMKVSWNRLMPAFKCSLSLGLAVLFGLLYNKENGYWSGLSVAISLASAREATFKVANVKAQGTVLGSVYGVLGCSLFGKFLPIVFLSLLPWFIFTSFLQRSRMYGQAGGISAVIGAVIILSRKNFGPPSQFAMARITETFIGLSCSIMVELLLQPTRASTLARTQLSKCLGTLPACVASVSLGCNSNISELKENQRRLEIQVSELGKIIKEADVEPNFWFLPFHSACYIKIFESLSKMGDILLFSAHAVGLLEQASQGSIADSWKELVNKLEDHDLKLFKEMVCSSIKCYERVTSMKFLTLLEKELAKNKFSCDLELGKSRSYPNMIIMESNLDEHVMEKIIDLYLQHSKELLDKIQVESTDHDELKYYSQRVLGLTALGYCISSLVRESAEIGKEIKELVQWENPSS